MIDYQVDADGIATLTWNDKDRPMNVMNAQTIDVFGERVMQAIVDEKVKGVTITSSRPEFLAGGDLGEILHRKMTPEESMQGLAKLSGILRGMETSGKPFVAAINGTALGGGFEICLACHRRIAADNPKTLIGLPEVTLGLLPAAGGTQRTARMIGIKNALPYLIDGQKVGTAQALADGLIDEVVPPAQLLARAKEWLLQDGAKSVVRPWDAKGFVFPGGTSQAPGPLQLFFGISAQVLRKSQGLYPAPEAILTCLYEGCQVDLDSGIKVEHRQFTRLARSVETRNMIRTLFFSMGEANRLAGRPEGVPKREFKKVAVLGAGMMGAGLALVSAQVGLEVVLLDVSLEAAEKGKSYARKVLDGQVSKGRLTMEARDRALALIRTTTDFANLAGCELVIEAVFENREVKAQVIAKAEAVLSADAIFASNTSTLPITSLAEVSSRPERFVGLHFFSPVERMALVEVIRGKQTSEATIAQAMDFAKRLRKTPIVVNDCRAFYANRAFGVFTFEAMAMLKEGVNPTLIENGARSAGMPMAPLALVDDFSVELAYKAMMEQKRDEGTAYQEQSQDHVLITMVEKVKRLGRKMGKGFYEYLPDGKKQFWPGFAEIYPRAKRQPTVADVHRRLLHAQAVEAARCVDEGIVSVRDADVGSLLGWGFPSALGGVISYIDMVGSKRFVAECDELAKVHGKRYEVPAQLRALAATGGRYHV